MSLIWVVTSASDLRSANPDVLSLDQVTSCALDVPETRTEEKQKNAEGKMVSYNPPRYKYSYNFKFRIYVDHPYFDDMSLQLNTSPVETGRVPIGENYRYKQDAVSDFLGVLAGQPNKEQRILPYAREYQSYVDMAAELQRLLMRKPAADETEKEEAAPAPEPAAPHMAPKGPVTCPNCTAETVPDADGCCEYCGSKIV